MCGAMAPFSTRGVGDLCEGCSLSEVMEVQDRPTRSRKRDGNFQKALEIWSCIDFFFFLSEWEMASVTFCSDINIDSNVLANRESG